MKLDLICIGQIKADDEKTKMARKVYAERLYEMDIRDKRQVTQRKFYLFIFF